MKARRDSKLTACAYMFMLIHEYKWLFKIPIKNLHTKLSN